MFSFFENLVDPFTGRFSIKQSDSAVEFLLGQLSGMKKFVLIVAILSACTALVEIYIFKFIGDLVDEISLVSAESFFEENFDVLLELCLVLLIGLPLVDFIHTLFCNQMFESSFPLKILSGKHQYLMKQNMDYYQREAAGKVANTLVQTAESAKQVVLKLVHTFTFALVFLISMVALLSTIDLYFLVPVGIWFVGFLLVVCYFVPKLKIWSNDQAGARSNMVGKLVDTYTNIATVKLFSHASSEVEYAHGYMNKYLKAIRRQMRFISKVLMLVTGFNTLLIFGTVILALVLWSKGFITVGAIAAAIAVVLRIYSMSHWIMWESVGVFNSYGVVQNGVKLLFNPLSEAAVNYGTEQNIDGNDISFKSVDFSYTANNQVIKSFSLDIASGERVGIVGRSGSGKSTLTKLLLRFYELDAGQISIGGKDVNVLDHEKLLENISVVTQEVELLDRTVRENLVYGKEFVSEQEMVAAAKAAGAHEFIVNLVDEMGRKGYEANVGVRGTKLSGGQRQRISIARALIKNAPILIFDEATSALDTTTEAEIVKNIDPFIKDKTVIMIAHRYSALSTMDRLIVVDGGELVDSGTHEELKHLKGFYSESANQQGAQLEVCELRT